MFLKNKKNLNLCVILRSYRFVAEVTFIMIVVTHQIIPTSSVINQFRKMKYFLIKVTHKKFSKWSLTLAYVTS